MDNPWKSLPNHEPYILPQEEIVVNEFNTKVTPEYQVKTELFPEPFTGNVNAPIYLLNLNAGYNENDLFWHSKSSFNSSIKSTLLHEKLDYPFYFLNPKFKESPGGIWWRQKLKKLITDSTLNAVSNNIFCVEYFPYHSKSYKDMPKRISPELLSSQNYSINLVREALKRNVIIIIMRSSKKWLSAIPELEGKKNVFELKNPQNVCITPNNLDGYNEILSVIKKC